jgi:hypothetical protein
MIKTAIGLHQDVPQAIRAANENRSFKLDWMGLENTLREILLQSPVRDRNATMRLIDDALAAFTKRGNSLPELQ